MLNFEYNNPITPRDFEIEINPNSHFYIKINSVGRIEYVNQDFCNVSGYNDYELIDESIDLLWHPDMPKVIFEILSENLAKKEKIRLVVKFISKDGRYFWLTCDFETKTNEYGEIVGHYNHSTFVYKHIVQQLGPLYHILSKIEAKSGNTKISKRYLVGYLEERNLSYNKYIDILFKTIPEYEKNNPYYQNQPIKSSTLGQEFHPNANPSNPFHHHPPELAPQEKSVERKSLFQRIFGSKH